METFFCKGGVFRCISIDGSIPSDGNILTDGSISSECNILTDGNILTVF